MAWAPGRLPSRGSRSPAVGNQPTGVAVADLNGDGKLDLAVANLRSNSVSVLINLSF